MNPLHVTRRKSTISPVHTSNSLGNTGYKSPGQTIARNTIKLGMVPVESLLVEIQLIYLGFLAPAPSSQHKRQSETTDRFVRCCVYQ